MLTLQDCIGLSELTDAEVAAIADHEHCPDIIAAQLGSYLLERVDGVPRIRAIIRDDIAAASPRGAHDEAARLKLVLRHFVECHRC